jgi:N utilization substance protein A
MKGELLSIIEFLEKDRGLDRGTVIEAVQEAIATAARKVDGLPPEVHVTIDPSAGTISAYSDVLVVPDDEPGPVVEEGQPPISWWHLKQVRKYHRDAQPGTTVRIVLSMEDFGRISAQTAKQVIIQRMREAEREKVLGEYVQRIGELVHGTVSRIERGTLIVDLGRTEAHLPKSEQSPTERYRPGDHIRAVVKDVKDTEEGRVPRVILSRAHAGLVRRLFETEVPEIYDGIVEIKAIAREAGFRTKIAVISHDPKIDSVGACVGIRGSRVKNIVQEIGGEKIDIVRWSENIEEFVANALAPVELARCFADPESERILVVVPDEQLSLAIGKSGQNIRLTSKLTQWKVDVVRQSEADRVAREHGVELAPEDAKPPSPTTLFGKPAGNRPERRPRNARERVASIFHSPESIQAGETPATRSLSSVPGMTAEIAKSLIEHGITNVDELLASDVASISAMPDIGEANAAALLDAARTVPTTPESV